MKFKSVTYTFAFILIFCLIFVQAAAAEETYIFVDKWGSIGIGDGQFNRPDGVAVDSVGNVYVTDLWNHRVQKFSSDGAFLKKWGSYGTDDGQFKYPVDITVDSAGNVFVTDSNQIQKFTADGTFLKRWGSLGIHNGQFNQTQGVAVDSSGNLYVADNDNNRVQKFTSEGIFLKTWGFYGTGNGQFNSPVGVAVDSANNVYITEYGNSRIQKFTSEGIFLKTWGFYGTGTSQFFNPKGVTVDSAGNVYVVENGNCRVQKFTSDGIFVTKWGSQGSGDGQLKNPTDIDVDSVGNVYVADYINHRIQKFASTSPMTTPHIPSNPTTPTVDPTLQYATWMKPGDYTKTLRFANEGTNVALVTSVDNPKQTNTVNFEIFKYDFFGLYTEKVAEIKNVPLNSAGMATTEWNANWYQGLVWGYLDPGYKFSAILVDNGIATNKKITSNIFKIRKIQPGWKDIPFDANYFINNYPDVRDVIKINAPNEVAPGSLFDVKVEIGPHSAINSGEIAWIFLTKDDIENTNFVVNQPGFMIDTQNSQSDIQALARRDNLPSFFLITEGTDYAHLLINLVLTRGYDESNVFAFWMKLLYGATGTPSDPLEVVFRLVDNYWAPLFDQTTRQAMKNVYSSNSLPDAIILYKYRAGNTQTNSLIMNMRIIAPNEPGDYYLTVGSRYKILTKNGQLKDKLKIVDMGSASNLVTQLNQMSADHGVTYTEEYVRENKFITVK